MKASKWFPATRQGMQELDEFIAYAKAHGTFIQHFKGPSIWDGHTVEFKVAA